MTIDTDLLLCTLTWQGIHIEYKIEPQNPVELDKTEEICCCCCCYPLHFLSCTSGTVSMIARINRRSFEPGDTAVVSGHVFNGSNATVSNVLLQLVEVSYKLCQNLLQLNCLVYNLLQQLKCLVYKLLQLLNCLCLQPLVAAKLSCL